MGLTKIRHISGLSVVQFTPLLSAKQRENDREVTMKEDCETAFDVEIGSSRWVQPQRDKTRSLIR